ncbi:MAG: hypothetical protein Q7T14_03680, partial [Aestuariivirga sp.]|nr:hypothetical protein [Aestuariivirga sp.]
MPLAPRAQRLRNAQATRAERLRRRKFRRNLFTFIVAQLVIAGVAFVGVRDYMSDGYLKHAVADALKQIAGGAPETKTAAVQPPPELDTAANEETAAVQQAPEEIEPAPPPVETETALASAPPEPVEIETTAPTIAVTRWLSPFNAPASAPVMPSSVIRSP